MTGPAPAEEPRRAVPQRHHRGLAVLITGLPGAGKSTLAQALAALLRETGVRRVTVLDGDAVRRVLGGGLGFSRRDRETVLRRIGLAAGEVARHGGIAVCAAIAPYAASRLEMRRSVEALGGFVEVHLSTPLEVCEARDRKGLYAKARAGLAENVTGIDDPYEIPNRPELRIDTSEVPPNRAAERVLERLRELGFVPERASEAPGRGAPASGAAPPHAGAIAPGREDGR